MYKIYDECPTFQNNTVTLRLIKQDDALELLNCYSDELALPLFNTDNCNGNTFYNSSLEGMQEAIKVWEICYKTKQFVRMTIILNKTQDIIGSIEMFNRGAAAYYGVHGVLRIDVMSKYETEEILTAILQLANLHFYQEFGVEWIVTKAIDMATKRIKVLNKLGYVPLRDFALNNYYGRIETQHSNDLNT